MSDNKKIRQVAEILNHIIEDTSVPRNIRRSAEEAKNLLLNEKEDISVRASSAIYILEEISNDRNLPMHARSIIWNAASELETL
jgi:hypothetical protein